MAEDRRYSMDARTWVAARAHFNIDVAEALPPTVAVAPGSYSDDRLVSVTVDHVAVTLTLTGYPEHLRAWATQVIRLADGLAADADALAAVDDGMEVEF